MLARPGLTITGFDDPLDAAVVRDAAARVLSLLGCFRLPVEIGEIGASDAVRLNRRFRGRGYVADVLSFPSPSSSAGGSAGEVLICPLATARSAARLGIPRRRRLAALAVHGVLHVLGYRHDDEESWRIMRALERVADRPGGPGWQPWNCR